MQTRRKILAVLAGAALSPFSFLRRRTDPDLVVVNIRPATDADYFDETIWNLDERANKWWRIVRDGETRMPDGTGFTHWKYEELNA